MKTAYLMGLAVLCGLLGCARPFHQKMTDTTVQFLFSQPEARQVALASSLDAYRPHPGVRGRDGFWRFSLPAGRSFKYFFLVDGKPTIPGCRWREHDDYGAYNCLFLPADTTPGP